MDYHQEENNNNEEEEEEEEEDINLEDKSSFERHQILVTIILRLFLSHLISFS